MADSANRFNLLVKTFKQANPNLTHEKAQKRVKEYYDTIKNKPDVEKLAREKITEWKHEGIQKRQKNTLLSFWKKSIPSVSTSSINTAKQTEPDVEILPAVDGPSVIRDIGKYLEQLFETIYEQLFFITVIFE